MSTTLTFGARLRRSREEFGALCVGIDPHRYLLAEWGLSDTAAAAEEFGLRVVEAAAGRVGIVKPQVAFFERFGSAGYTALERVMRAAHQAGLIVIADAKRGDVGSSVDAYGEAWLSPGSPLEADAMTVSAFQGVGSLAGPLRLAADNGKGLFVLAATSNPEAAALQQAVLASSAARGMTLARAIIEGVTDFNHDQLGRRADDRAQHDLASVGVVLGATLRLEDFGIDTTAPAPGGVLPVLAPGFGHQGARLEDAGRIYGRLLPGVLVSESRSVLAAGPGELGDVIATRAAKVRDRLG